MKQIICPKCKMGMNRLKRLEESFWKYGLSCEKDGIFIKSNYPIIDGKLPKEVDLS